MGGSDNLTSAQIVEDVISMESNKYDTANEQKENSALGLTPRNVLNTTNTLETIDSETLKNITKGPYRLGIFSKSSSSKKTKRKQKEVGHSSRPEHSAGLNSDTVLGPRKGPKGNA